MSLRPDDCLAFLIDGRSAREAFYNNYIGILWRNGNGNVFVEDHCNDFGPVGPDAKSFVRQFNNETDGARVELLDALHEEEGAKFHHNRNDFDKLLAMDHDERDSLLEAWFAREMNQQLDNPFIYQLKWDGDQPTFTNGSQEELERLLRLFVLTDDSTTTQIISICSGNFDERASYLSDWALLSDRLTTLIELALQHHEFEGMGEPQYCENSGDRENDYSYDNLVLEWWTTGLTRGASVRERMKAPVALRAWLLSIGANPELYVSVCTPLTLAPSATSYSNLIHTA